MPSTDEDQQAYHSLVMIWLGEYQMHTPGTLVYQRPALLCPDTPVGRPVAALAVNGERGARSCVAEPDRPFGPPELAVEVVVSGKEDSDHAKTGALDRAEIPEYVMMAIRNQRVCWQLTRCTDQPQIVDHNPRRRWRSALFPGLWLDCTALAAKDRIQMLEELHRGLRSAEHNAFADRLRHR